MYNIIEVQLILLIVIICNSVGFCWTDIEEGWFLQYFLSTKSQTELFIKESLNFVRSNKAGEKSQNGAFQMKQKILSTEQSVKFLYQTYDL